MSNLKHKVPIAPLSDARWRNIEEGLFDQLDREPVSMPAVLTPHDAPPRRNRRSVATLIFAATAAAAALLLLGVVLRDVGPGDPTARIATDAAGSRLAFGDADIDVSPNSIVLLRGDADSGVLAIIEKGEARFVVAPRDNRPPFAVSAGDVRVEVVGTIFSVARDGDAASVSVTEGKVRVSHGSERVMVTSGQVWEPGANAADRAGPATEQSDVSARRRAERRPRGEAALDQDSESSDETELAEAGLAEAELDEAELDEAELDEAELDEAARASDEAEGAGPVIELDESDRDDDSNWNAIGPVDESDEAGEDVAAEPTRMGLTKRERRERARQAKKLRRKRAKARRERARAERRAREQARRKAEVELPPPVNRSQADPASARYLRAAELEASSPKRALALYREIAGEKNEWSELALFAWGRLELERGNKDAARKVLKRYLARYPRGRNRADAKALLDDAE